MKSIHIILLFLVGLLMNKASYSQQTFQGKAYYISKTDIETFKVEWKNMSEEQKKRMEKRGKSMSEKSYVLEFNKTESIYKLQEKLESPIKEQGWGRFRGMMSGAMDGNKYKNINSKELIVRSELLGKIFLVKDPLPTLEWKLTGEIKKIGQYTCFKATVLQTWENFTMANMRRPTKQINDQKKPKTPTTITAWYTMQIPVNHGPGDYWGLPGLILEVNLKNITLLCSKIVLNPNEKLEIKAPKKGKKISRDEYTKLASKKFAEMRENFRKRRANNSQRRRN